MKRQYGSRLTVLIWVVAVLALSGCAELGTPLSNAESGGIPFSVVHADTVSHLVRYFNDLPALTSAQLNYEHARAERAFLENPSVGNRIRLVMLLGLPNATFQDYDRALKLLQPCQNGQVCGGSRKDFALFLSHVIVEWKMQKDAIKQGQSQIDALKKKLDAIKSIEKSINERENSQILHGK
ncbi:MAG: hypothetical protein KGJ12_06605 [Gammaproteobacteria bacterium]|nr:hypothetical protein [Gammaproteobacteria bacterium]